MNKKEPLVMCLTNSVAQDITANALLAIGAKPAMLEDPAEAMELASVADAALINLGTISKAQAEVLNAALPMNCPWVLDPVAVHQLTYRREVIKQLLTRQLPTVIRGNIAEIDFIRNKMNSFLSRNFGSVPMLATGMKDIVYSSDDEKLEINGGVEMLTQVTATGCSQGAIVAAFLGWGQTPVEAIISASRLMKRAGELAWQRTKTPGSFRVSLIDALYELSRGLYD